MWDAESENNIYNTQRKIRIKILGEKMEHLGSACEFVFVHMSPLLLGE